MFTILIDVIISVFVVNFKASGHPYLICFIKGMFTAVAMFLYFLIEGYIDNDPVPIERMFVFVPVIFGVGIGLSLLLMLFTWLNSDTESK